MRERERQASGFINFKNRLLNLRGGYKQNFVTLYQSLSSYIFCNYRKVCVKKLMEEISFDPILQPFSQRIFTSLWRSHKFHIWASTAFVFAVKTAVLYMH